ncbi:hypothetical protein ACQ4PT_060574 [Festuca glaucescens]
MPLAPPAYQNPHDLTFFWVAYNNMGWGAADHCFFTEPGLKHRGSDSAQDRQLAEERHDDEDMTADNREAHNRDDEEVPELPSMTVAKTQTYVDVLWQDGTRQCGIPSKSMVPFNIMNEHEFLPGDHVLDNAASLDGATASTINDDDTASDVTKPARHTGIVRTVCCKDRTVNVSWFKVAACPNEGREVECNDTVSTYSLERESGDTPNLGYTVVRLLPSSWSEMKKNVAPDDLSWVGHVIDHPDGHVQVKWGDGSISTVFPHEIFVPRQEDYMVRNHGTDEDSSTNDDETDEDSSTDDDEEPAAANTVSIHPALYYLYALLPSTHAWHQTVFLLDTFGVLQVLVSIQGLVLNDQPYYNEAGYERQVGTPAGRRNAYLLTLWIMLYLLRRPPQGFEGFVKDHFGRRGRFVLGTCEAYLQGCVDGMHMKDDNAAEAGKERPCSAGLKLALANMVPSLLAAFKELGANGCEVF